MNTLILFNAVLAKESNNTAYLSEDGYIIEPNALWAKDTIISFYEEEKLSGNDLNKTFHKSWKKIKNSSRCELLIHQIMHYLSTYGSNFQDEVYIPEEVLKLPDLKLTYKVVKAYTEEEMTEKCLAMLQSGIALKEETINMLLTILVDEIGYQFTGNEGIRNKEAIIKIADLYGVLPVDTMEFFRYIIYRATGQSLLIKSNEVINAIKSTNFNPSAQFRTFGLEKLAEIFNRFKPLFLAFKSICPKTINKISKLSKIYHKPLVINPLNLVTSILLSDRDLHWLDNATPFALFKALSACYSRTEGQDSFVYRIRNGKSWTTTNEVKAVNKENMMFLLRYMKTRFDLSGTKIFLPENIKFAVPTSEKMFIENIPTGTKFFAKKMAVGIYWKNSWGANDLDLSGVNIGGKVGWNSVYKQGEGNLMFSGDITNAPDGAVEYLYAHRGLSDPTLVLNNVFNGSETSEYKIIIGAGDHISKNYMMNPENLFVEVKTQAVQKHTILGLFLPEKDSQSFVLLNFGAGHLRVSRSSGSSDLATKALYQQWKNPLDFQKLVEILGAEIVEKREEADIDFSLDVLEKDHFIKLF